MSLKFKANNFSIETAYNSNTTAQHNTYKTTKPKIDLLMKRIIDDRKREKKKIVAFGSVFLSIILIFNFFQI
jgi:Holliday junction resolvase RusA-like endonuclease|tara:strand:- start:190 stop:405 length:216 start_codon:yes stop_codon:yes gene_type:complete